MAVPDGGDWIFSFSRPVKVFSILWGDYSIAEEDTLELSIHDVFYGDLTQTSPQFWQFPLGNGVSIGGTQFTQVRVSSLSSEPGMGNSVYLDNIDILINSPNAPEPGSLALLATGLVGLGALWLRRRRRQPLS